MKAIVSKMNRSGVGHPGSGMLPMNRTQETHFGAVDGAVIVSVLLATVAVLWLLWAK
jgi:hypothetical protein